MAILMEVPMERLMIRSGMAHFEIVSKILAVSSDEMEAEAELDGAPRFAGLEAMAQTAALHARHHLAFERHAFLLSVRRCQMPPIAVLSGRFRVAAVLRGRSSEAFSYQVAAKGPGGVDFDGDLLIGTMAYDHRFRKEALKAHYQRIWNRLRQT
jgi:hypothetical protein